MEMDSGGRILYRCQIQRGGDEDGFSDARGHGYKVIALAGVGSTMARRGRPCSRLEMGLWV